MSTIFLYTCPEFVIRGAPKEQPRSLFVFTLRVDYCVVEKLHARAVRSHLESSFCAPPRPWCFAAMSSARADSVGSDMTAASGDQGQADRFVSDRAQKLIDAQTVLRKADKATDLVGRTPLPASATAETVNSGQNAFRIPRAPYNERDDVGWLAIYQGNWSGHRANPALAQHIIQDVILNNPCHIVVAQEVDPKTEKAMRDVINPEGRQPLHAHAWSSSGASCSAAAPATAGLSSSAAAAPATAGLSSSAVQPMWIVAVGEDVDQVKTNLVAVRSTYATAVDVLEWHKTTDGVYKAKLTKAQRKNGKKDKREVEAISRILVVEVTLKQPWAGRTKIKIANVHLHYMTAKAQGPFKLHSQKWWAGFRSILERWDIDIIAGDFNMSLWMVVPILRTTRIVSLVSAYAFLSDTSTVAIAEGNEDDASSEDDPASGSAEPRRASATAEPTTESTAAVSRRYTEEQLDSWTPPPDVHSDSCGIFLVKTAKSIKRVLTVESFLLGRGLQTFQKGQGYPYKSYRGGVEAVRETLLYSQEAFADTRDRGICRDVREHIWPPVKERPIAFGKFDPDSLLFRSGAHAPLMVWMGFQGRRAPDRLQDREQKAIARGWGPGSDNRARSMQREGKGPRPQSCTRDRGDGNSRDGGAVP